MIILERKIIENEIYNMKVLFVKNYKERNIHNVELYFFHKNIFLNANKDKIMMKNNRRNFKIIY